MIGRKFQVGQAFFGRIQFSDGCFPEYDRPYLVVKVDEEYIEILNISSVKGKEWKLAMPTNWEIIKHDPPFPKPSFAKLDSLQKIHIANLSNVRMLRSGEKLAADEMDKIIRMLYTDKYSR